jgi:hypothetical protein
MATPYLNRDEIESNPPARQLRHDFKSVYDNLERIFYNLRKSYASRSDKACCILIFWSLLIRSCA